MTEPSMARTIRITLAEHSLTLAGVVRRRGLSYDRAVRILCGYRKPRSGELEELLRAVEELATVNRPRDSTK